MRSRKIERVCVIHREGESDAFLRESLCERVHVLHAEISRSEAENLSTKGIRPPVEGLVQTLV